ncbi:MAG: hypothetical protein PUF62_04025 [Bacteroidales bacterium]|nr:hypothetical protein [Bacteroidales bacterium]
MNKEDIAFRKLSMLMKAVTEANERETQENAAQSIFFDRMEQLPTEDKKIDCSASNEATEAFYGCCSLEELKDAAFEVLLLNPGCEQSDWARILVEQYGTEVVDAYGKDPAKAYASLEDLWESPYFDRNSAREYDFKTWAEAFSTDAAVQMYYDLIEKKMN